MINFSHLLGLMNLVDFEPHTMYLVFFLGQLVIYTVMLHGEVTLPQEFLLTTWLLLLLLICLLQQQSL